MPWSRSASGPSLVAVVPLAAALAAFPSAAAGQWRAIPVAGGPDAIALAGGLAPGLPAWRVPYEAARRRHGLWGEDAGFTRAREAPGPQAGRVALPLAPDLWRALLRRSVPDDGLVAVILEDRRASLVYRGLAALDDPTIAALADAETLQALYDRHAEAFAALCGRFRVKDGAVVLPGGAGAEPLWSDLVRETAGTPSAFLLALLASSGGRRALLFDAIAGLDAAHQRFALCEGLPLPERKERFRALAAAFDREPAWWKREGGAFRRPEADAARLLREVRVSPDGSLAPPAAQAFWEAVLGDRVPPPAAAFAALVRSSPRADAAWLAERVSGVAPAERAVRLSQVLFAPRVFGEAGEEALADVAIALKGLRDAPALVLALERIGTRDPSVYAAGLTAARLSDRVPARGRRERVERALQGALGVMDRARFAGTLDAAASERLLRALFALPVMDARAWGPALARWIGGELLPALAGPEAAARAGVDPEAIVLGAMAGEPPGASRRAGPPRVEWQGARYEVDEGRAERRRLERVRARQGGAKLAEALATCPSVEMEEACEGALGLVLASIVYASHLGDPDGPALAGEDPSLRHEFGAVPWALPEEAGPGAPWHARGSLLGLERPLGRLSLHRLAGDALPEEPPVLDAAVARRLAASAALVNPRDLDDAGRDALAQAVAEGRRRVAALRPGEGPAVEALIAESGVEPWRGRAFAWLLEHEPAVRDGFFSLQELARLGGVSDGRWDAWGASDPIAAGLRPRLPPPSDPSGRVPADVLGTSFVDLNLRVAVHLAERGLPARLAPALVKSLLPDLFDEARPIAADDRLGLEAWVRGLGRERLDEAVSSLAGGGPLVPVAAPEGAR